MVGIVAQYQVVVPKPVDGALPTTGSGLTQPASSTTSPPSDVEAPATPTVKRPSIDVRQAQRRQGEAMRAAVLHQFSAEQTPPRALPPSLAIPEELPVPTASSASALGGPVVMEPATATTPASNPALPGAHWVTPQSRINFSDPFDGAVLDPNNTGHAFMADGLQDNPDVLRTLGVGDGQGPNTVYTNGILIGPDEAQRTARQLSNDVNAPVATLYAGSADNAQQEQRYRQRQGSDRLPLVSPRLDDVSPAMRDTAETISGVMGNDPSTVRAARQTLEAHLSRNPPRDLHVIAHSQGTMIWSNAVEQWTTDRVEQRLRHLAPGENRSAVAAQARREAEQLLHDHLLVENMAPVTQLPPGPNYINWVNDGDMYVQLLGSDSNPGVTIRQDDVQRVAPDAHLRDGHSPSAYAAMRSAYLRSPEGMARLLETVPERFLVE